MAKASGDNHDEFEDDEYEPPVKAAREYNRSKHSETEQRRRSKINERFQKLRDIIPQNDQKRDKASFLLEVIEYIQFLQEKIKFYEGSNQGWNPEPTKLTPWKSHHRPGENFAVHSQVMNNGSGLENNVVISHAMLTNTQNSVESDLDSAAVYKALDHIRGLATLPVPNVHQENIFDSIESIGVPRQPLQESNSDAENTVSQPRYSQLWPGIRTPTGTESKLHRQDENRPVSISSAYSRGVLDNLTLALGSSGVDLSQANIKVELDVGNRADGSMKCMSSHSKAHVTQCVDNQLMTTHSQASSFNEPVRKRSRTGES